MKQLGSSAEQYFGTVPMRLLIATIVLLTSSLITGCGSTAAYVADPKTRIVTSGEVSTGDAGAAWLNSIDGPYRMVFCEASPETGECLEPSVGLTAKGLGAIFLPLTMEWNAIDVQARDTEADKKPTVRGKVSASVNGIAPRCARVRGVLQVVDEQTLVLKLNRFYCNWVGIGNVLTSAQFSFQTFDVDSQTGNGYYRLAFYGTGNARGSGYFKVSLEPTR
ncbi:MAG: hypothetical protein AAF438_21905 [Pseudomonadota bacterium]